MKIKSFFLKEAIVNFTGSVSQESGSCAPDGSGCRQHFCSKIKLCTIFFLKSLKHLRRTVPSFIVCGILCLCNGFHSTANDKKPGGSFFIAVNFTLGSLCLNIPSIAYSSVHLPASQGDLIILRIRPKLKGHFVNLLPYKIQIHDSK